MDLYVVAALVMGLIMRYIQGEGLLASVAVPGTSKVVRAAIAKTLYDGWWAGIAWHSFPGAIAYFLIGTIGLYVILVQIAVGLVVFRLVLGLGTDSLIEVSIDRYNRDGLAGWRAVSNVLNTVYLSFLVLAIGLSLMILANGSEYVVIPGLVVLWLILVPVFIVVPLWTFGAQMSRSKQVVIDEYVERATVESAAADDGWSAATDAVVRDGAASLQNLPSLPLNLPQGLISVVAALLPLAAALYKAGV